MLVLTSLLVASIRRESLFGETLTGRLGLLPIPVLSIVTRGLTVLIDAVEVPIRSGLRDMDVV